MSAARPSSAVRRYAIAGLAVVAILFGGLGSWASLAPLAGAIIAPGIVAVDTNRKAVQHLEGGIVSAILVKEGDLVQQGATIVQLDATQAGAKQAIMQGELDLLRAREARLAAERDGRDTVTFPIDLDRRREREPPVAETLAGEAELFAARRTALAGRIAVLRKRPVLLEDEIRGLDALVTAKGHQIGFIQKELDAQRTLFEKGHVPISKLLELERLAAALEGERGQNQAEIARAKSAIDEAALRLLELENDFREQTVSDLRETQSQIFDLRERLLAARDVLHRTEVTAPETGFVVGLAVHTVGGVVAPGETLMEIVPDKDILIINARVRPEDVDHVAAGQIADVRLSALDDATTPTLKGSVSGISADRLVDEQTGMPYYRARILLPESEIERLGRTTLVPGMPAEIFIRTGERTALDYLLKPLRDSFSRAFRET